LTISFFLTLTYTSNVVEGSIVPAFSTEWPFQSIQT
jgi:hypothetical protein